MQRDELFDRVLGGLYGQALGDSYCMPALLRPQLTWKRFGWVENFYDAPAEHPAHHGLKAGRVTDDTEQAMSFAQVIIRSGKITVEGAAQAMVAWYDRVDGDHNDTVGPSTRKAVARLKEGADPHLTGLQGDTDGGAMRICPIGLINPGNLERAVEDTSRACQPSHYTDVAVSGAAAVAGAIAVAMVPGATLADIIEGGKLASEKGLAYGTTWFGASISRRIDLAVNLAKQDKALYDCLVDIFDLVGCGLLTSEAVPSAFGVLYLGGGDIMATAKYAANLSGDADTIGAMACAIAGAWKGYKAFPAFVIETIDRVNPEWNFRETAEGLTRLALSNQ